MKNAILEIHVPYKQDEPMKKWHALEDKLKSSANRPQGLVELAYNAWIIPMPTGLSFLSFAVLACEQSNLKLRVAFLEDEILGSSTFLVGKADKIGFSGGDDTGENVSTDIGVGRSLACEPYGLR